MKNIKIIDPYQYKPLLKTQNSQLKKENINLKKVIIKQKIELKEIEKKKEMALLTILNIEEQHLGLKNKKYKLSKFDDTKKKNITLQKEFTNYKQENKKLFEQQKETIQNLEIEIKNFKIQKNNNIKNEIVELQKEKNLLSQKNEKQTGELTSKENEIMNLKRDKTNLQKTLRVCKTKLQTKMKELSTVSLKLEEQNKQRFIIKKKKEIEKYKTVVKSKKKELPNLKKKNKTLRKNIKELDKKIIKNQLQKPFRTTNNHKILKKDFWGFVIDRKEKKQNEDYKKGGVVKKRKGNWNKKNPRMDSEHVRYTKIIKHLRKENQTLSNNKKQLDEIQKDVRILLEKANNASKKEEIPIKKDSLYDNYTCGFITLIDFSKDFGKNCRSMEKILYKQKLNEKFFIIKYPDHAMRHLSPCMTFQGNKDELIEKKKKPNSFLENHYWFLHFIDKVREKTQDDLIKITPFYFFQKQGSPKKKYHMLKQYFQNEHYVNDNETPDNIKKFDNFFIHYSYTYSDNNFIFKLLKYADNYLVEYQKYQKEEEEFYTLIQDHQCNELCKLFTLHKIPNFKKQFCK
ncbi:synaptonemal complex protein zip1 [Anaeramoeba flamelloides]|uniref:Synaptonemal complex protein zip1 n=1 Tax=Anaeramoeba flamelloides TaxID=1746091 RepID=A0AAV7ZJL8_9EUKA|nr:synaptonemal complex protein zip1 [Anaeramoeba flamelloides]